MDKLRCSIGYEKMENDFYRYSFAVPVEDLGEGYQLYNSSAFQCEIDGDVKVVSIVAIEAFTVINVKYEGDEELLSAAFGFVGLPPMTTEEFEKMQEERAKAEEEAKKEAEGDDVTDVEYEQVEAKEEDEPFVLPHEIDLTGK